MVSTISGQALRTLNPRSNTVRGKELYLGEAEPTGYHYPAPVVLLPRYAEPMWFSDTV